VKKVPQSNIVVVKSLKNPAKVRDETVGNIMKQLGVPPPTTTTSTQPQQQPQPQAKTVVPPVATSPTTTTSSQPQPQQAKPIVPPVATSPTSVALNNHSPPASPRQDTTKPPEESNLGSSLVTVFQVLFVIAFIYYEWRQIKNIKNW